jgi:hypothetical protein
MSTHIEETYNDKLDCGAAAEAAVSMVGVVSDEVQVSQNEDDSHH